MRHFGTGFVFTGFIFTGFIFSELFYLFIPLLKAFLTIGSKLVVVAEIKLEAILRGQVVLAVIIGVLSADGGAIFVYAAVAIYLQVQAFAVNN